MNKCLFTGNLTRDPEMKYTTGGTAVCNIGLAVNEKWKDSNGETKERVSFLEMVAWGRTAEVITEYLHKGDKILVETKAEQQTWDDKESGDKRSKIVFNIEKMEMLTTKGSKNSDGGDSGSSNGGGGEKRSNSKPSGGKKQQEPEQSGGDPDDVPF